MDMSGLSMPGDTARDVASQGVQLNRESRRHIADVVSGG